MNRRVAIVVSALLLTTLIAAGALARATRRSSVSPETALPNPAHFVASDVKLVASTGRPQLVEVFHYG
jgi:hypothetical protein